MSNFVTNCLLVLGSTATVFLPAAAISQQADFYILREHIQCLEKNFESYSSHFEHKADKKVLIRPDLCPNIPDNPLKGLSTNSHAVVGTSGPNLRVVDRKFDRIILVSISELQCLLATYKPEPVYGVFRAQVEACSLEGTS